MSLEADPEQAPSECSPLLGSPAPPKGNSQGARDGPQGSSNPEDVPLAEEPSTVHLLGIMSSIWLGTFLAALDSTMVATLVGPISSSFHSFTLVSWLASAYFIANAALQPLAGKLTDIYGRRAGLVVSNVLFAAGNLVCGLAQDEGTMIAGRVVAGMGGGGLTAISTFVGSDLVPLRRRGVWQGLGNIMFGLGAALGGVFGGAINDWVGWRAAFYVQVPLTAVSTGIVWWTVRIPVRASATSRIRRVDFLGAGTLVLTLVLLLLGLNSGGNTVPWTHPLVLATLPLSGVLLAAFVYIEASVVPEPVIPVRIMLNRTVLAACLTNWFVSMAYFSTLFYLPIYFQLRGASPTQAGLRLMPASAGVMLGSVGTGLIMRALGRYWYLNLGVQAVLVASFASLLAYDLTTPRWPEYLSLAGGGIGFAGMLTVCLIALISAVEHRFQAVITSASYAFRSTGSTIGITISSAVFQNILQSSLWHELGGRPDAADVIRRVRDSLDSIRSLPADLRPAVEHAYMLALNGVFATVLGLVVLGAVVSLLMREHKLHANLARRD